MSSPINLIWFNKLVSQYLITRLSATQLSSLNSLPNSLFLQLLRELDESVNIYNSFPTCLSGQVFSPEIFLNTIHLKRFILTLPLYSSTLDILSQNHQALDSSLSEMRDSTYFNFIYKITEPSHLLANLMTLLYRCYLLSNNPRLRVGEAQISSTLEEMSALRYLQGNSSTHFQAIKHWIIDWEVEGFSQELAAYLSR